MAPPVDAEAAHRPRLMRSIERRDLLAAIEQLMGASS